MIETQRKLSEQELIRRENLKKIIDSGIDPYPAEKYEVSHYSADIKRDLKGNESQFQEVSVAGRLMTKRIMGKASFASIQDSKGSIQIYISRDEIAEGDDKALYNDVFKKWLDIGDFIGIKGSVFTTQTGEVTVHAKELVLLCKSLRPLPIVKEKEGKVFDAFTDPQQRYRQRYVDLIVNPGVREVFAKRASMIQSMREFLIEKGYLEVETPVLQPIYGGALARPFKTHHNTLDMTLFLRIANELYLKRLIVGGYEGVFEFAKDFRNEGMGRFHNPEFTQLEFYVAYKDYYWMMDCFEEMMERVVKNLCDSTKVLTGDHEIDFKRPWKRYTMYEVIKEFSGVNIEGMEEDELRKVAKNLKVELDESMGKGKIIDEMFGEVAEPHLIQPTIIMDYPIEMSPLAKHHRSKEGVVERFECIINGKEICNAFSELNDPIDQRKRLEAQIELGKRGDDEAMVLDEDFIKALEFGMPPTSGIGIGIDRLAMIMTNSRSIQDVLFFPQMRAEH